MSERDSAPARRSYKGLTRAERDELRRRRLLDAALDAFGGAGYAATSVDAVCTAAGVSTRNFYEYFAGREGLLIALYDEIVAGAQRATLEALIATAGDRTVRVRARAGLGAFAGYMLDDERRARVNFVEVVGASRAVEAHRRAALRSFAAILLDVSHQLMRAGVLATRPEHQLKTATTALVGAVQETLTDWMSSEIRAPLDQVVDDLVEFFAVLAAPDRAA